jgi:hypothetical protein
MTYLKAPLNADFRWRIARATTLALKQQLCFQTGEDDVRLKPKIL